MTTGQGGPGPGPYGQPPYGRPPYGPPPYGPPPYGQPPYGQPPYGYAPSAPAGPPPAPRERPLSVRAGLGAFTATVVFGVVGAVVSVLNWDVLIGGALAMESAQIEAAGLDAADLAELGLRISIGVSVVVTLLHVLFIWFAWRGFGWARIVLFVFGGLGLAFGAARALAQASPVPFLDVLGIFQFLTLAVGVVLLALAPSSDWYRSEKERRAVTGPR